MKFFIHFFTGIILTVILFGLPYIASGNQVAQEKSSTDPNCIKEIQQGSSIWEFRENYVPKQYFPTPEYMVFADMGILILIMAAGLFFVFKKSAPWKLSLLAIISLVYLGLIRGGCICPVGVITNVTIGMVNPKMVGLVTLIVFISPLVFALIAGRVFCTAGCPLGAIQHLFYKKKKHYKLPLKINTAIKVVPVVLLIATVYFALKSTYFLACELEPYKAVFFTGKTWIVQLMSLFNGQPVEAKFLWAFGTFAWIYLITILAVGYWIPRPFCRLMCPYGVLLGLFSMFSLKQRRIDNENCIHCGACQKICPTQAIVIDRKNKAASLSNYDCIQCNKCNESCKSDAINHIS